MISSPVGRQLLGIYFLRKKFGALKSGAPPPQDARVFTIKKILQYKIAVININRTLQHINLIKSVVFSIIFLMVFVQY